MTDKEEIRKIMDKMWDGLGSFYLKQSQAEALMTCYKELEEYIGIRRKGLDFIARQYNRLLCAVGIEYPRISRHDTILRYIREGEDEELEQRRLKTVNKNRHADWKEKLEVTE